MDPQTGELYGPLPSRGERPGDQLTDTDLEDLLREKLAADQRAEAERALAHLESGGRLVAVDEPVVQRLRLGDRELRRRKRRQR